MWAKFKKNKRGYYSLVIFLALFFTTMAASFIANDKPLLVKYQGNYHFPVFKKYSESTFGGQLKSETDFKDPYIINLIKDDGFIIFPLIKFSYDTINLDIKNSAPTPPDSQNILGTDDQGRDLLARIIYGVRISLIFGITLSALSLVIGVSFGAIQGYFGGKIDLFFQRFIEIWSSMPILFLLIIISSIVEPSFGVILLIMLLFSWLGLVGFVRAEFLRLRNFDFVKASTVVGSSNFRIIFYHILPNASPIIIANLPFLVAASITTLTSLDFLGFGLSFGYPSLGEVLNQGKNNVNAYWIGISGFLTITILLTLLVFIGEALRDVFDSRS